MVLDVTGIGSTVFYLNQTVSLKTPLLPTRQVSVDFMQGIQRHFPQLENLRHVPDEVALESPERPEDKEHIWVSLRSKDIESSWKNPAEQEQAYGLHKRVLETAPFTLSIAPMEIDYLELLFGFDFTTTERPQQVIFRTFNQDSPLTELVAGNQVTGYRPSVEFRLGDDPNLIGLIEVESKEDEEAVVTSSDSVSESTISVYMAVRRLGIKGVDMRDISKPFDRLRTLGERLIEERVKPSILDPIYKSIMVGPGYRSS